MYNCDYKTAQADSTQIVAFDNRVNKDWIQILVLSNWDNTGLIQFPSED